MSLSDNFSSPIRVSTATFSSAPTNNNHITATRDKRTIMQQPPPPPPPYPPPPSKRDLLLSKRNQASSAKEEYFHPNDINNGTIVSGASYNQNGTTALIISSDSQECIEKNIPENRYERTSLSLPKITNPLCLLRSDIVAASKNINNVDDKFDDSITTSAAAYESMDGEGLSRSSFWVFNNVSNNWEGSFVGGHHHSSRCKATGSRMSALPVAAASRSSSHCDSHHHTCESDESSSFRSQDGGDDGNDKQKATTKINNFSGGEYWTPQDSAYGAAIPICGFIPKQMRRTIEMSLIICLVLCVVYLIVTTSIRITNDEHYSNGIAGNNNETNDSNVVDSYVSNVSSYYDTSDENDDMNNNSGNDDGANSSEYVFMDDDFYAAREDD